MAGKVGYICSVKLGSNTVKLIGAWSLDGIAADQIDTSAFTDNWKTFEFGMKDGGTISFSGLYDPTDADGQQALMNANLENTDLTTLKLYVDSTSYFEPCQTTGYFSPTTTQNASTKLSNVNITGFNVAADKADVIKVDFTAKVSGVMVLV
jgi:hypothetical protein